ncbi:MAG: hypothetical protein ACFB3T_14595 [Geminicoccaceae bacterium]
MLWRRRNRTDDPRTTYRLADLLPRGGQGVLIGDARGQDLEGLCAELAPERLLLCGDLEGQAPPELLVLPQAPIAALDGLAAGSLRWQVVRGSCPCEQLLLVLLHGLVCVERAGSLLIEPVPQADEQRERDQLVTRFAERRALHLTAFGQALMIAVPARFTP